MQKTPKTDIGKIINYIRNISLSRLLLSFMHNGYLLEIGWFESLKRKECIDENGEPIPWAPYPYINFLKDYLNEKMTVFEFGSGYSTLFFSNRVKKVFCVEHDLDWVTKLKLDKKDNIIVFNKKLDIEYEETLLTIDEKLDLIVIDGRRRVNCIKIAANKIQGDGLIVLDDSDRIEYQDGINHLINLGFKKINFTGISPLAFINRKTTIFFKTF
ncbi:MAG: hypothetical protein R6W78_10610 [Bacteroidales bacterium]